MDPYAMETLFTTTTPVYRMYHRLDLALEALMAETCRHVFIDIDFS